jgi:hypothetical protein
MAALDAGVALRAKLLDRLPMPAILVADALPLGLAAVIVVVAVVIVVVVTVGHAVRIGRRVARRAGRRGARDVLETSERGAIAVIVVVAVIIVVAVIVVIAVIIVVAVIVVVIVPAILEVPLVEALLLFHRPFELTVAFANAGVARPVAGEGRDVGELIFHHPALSQGEDQESQECGERGVGKRAPTPGE